jgi:putative lipoprotein
MMNRKVLLALLLASSSVRAAEDSWTGPDKELHFGISAGLAAGAYGVVALESDDTATRLLGGLIVAGLAGIGKEALDAVDGGDASFRDLAADGAGIATGLLTAFAVDMFIRWLTEPEPVPEPRTQL